MGIKTFRLAISCKKLKLWFNCWAELPLCRMLFRTAVLFFVADLGKGGHSLFEKLSQYPDGSEIPTHYRTMSERRSLLLSRRFISSTVS